MTLTLRPPLTDDLPVWADLWYDRVSLTRGHLPAERRAAFLSTLTGWLADPGVFARAGLIEDRLVGGIAAQPVDGIAQIRDLSLDLHRYHGGSARLLVNALREWAAATGLTGAVVAVPRGAAVEQAFWLSMGAARKASPQRGSDRFWLTIP